MSEKEINVTLYHAGWCGYCREFIPKWKKFSSICQIFNEEIKKDYNIKLSCEEFKDETDNAVMKENNINGFPTVIIDVDKKKEHYSGNRTDKALLKTILQFSDKNVNDKQKEESINRWSAKAESLLGENVITEGGENGGDDEPKVHNLLVKTLTNLGLQKEQTGGVKNASNHMTQEDSIAFYKYLKYKQKYIKSKKLNLIHK